MEYPESKLTRPIRRAILSAFIVIFFILSPVIVMYAAGYRYDFKNGLLRETGAISVDILPSEAAVYLDNLKLKDKLPLRLKNLTPGKYHLKITASGYYDWVKEVEVKNKQTVYIKEIVLIKKNKPRLLAQKNIVSLSLSPNGRYLLYGVENGGATETWLRDARRQNEVLISRLPPESKINVAWAEKNNWLYVASGVSPYSNLLIFNTETPEKQFNLIKEIGAPVIKPSWKETADAELFFEAKGKIMSIFPATRQKFTLAKNTFMDWYMENGRLWTIEANTSTEQLKIIKDAIGFRSDFTLIDNTGEFEDQKNYWQIVIVRDEHALIKKSGQPEMTLLTPDKKFNLSGEWATISKYNNWWLIWSPWELWTYSEGEDPYLLNRSGEQLREVLPLDEYNTLGLIYAEKTNVLFPYYLVSHELLNQPVISAAADSAGRIFYFAGEIEGQKGLWQLDY